MNFKYAVQIKETNLDLFGHVNNATYLTLFEEARWEMMVSRGYPVEKVLSEKKGPIILDVQLKFLRELKARDQVDITFEIIEIKKKTATGKQQMIFSSGEKQGQVASELIFTSAFFDMSARKIIEPNDLWLKVLGVSP